MVEHLRGGKIPLSHLEKLRRHPIFKDLKKLTKTNTKKNESFEIIISSHLNLTDIFINFLSISDHFQANCIFLTTKLGGGVPRPFYKYVFPYRLFYSFWFSMFLSFSRKKVQFLVCIWLLWHAAIKFLNDVRNERAARERGGRGRGAGRKVGLYVLGQYPSPF